MARAFAQIAFTPNVKKMQTEMGSRHGYQAFEDGIIEGDYITDNEAQFIAQRDSFYQATVSENGWPYVQHRGGPKGFLKVLDEQTIGYADFSGNRQYLSTGNLLTEERVSLILMDYPKRMRLKIWGRARLVDEVKEPALVAQLEPDEFRAPVERGIIIKVEAIDWNCPKYITPRFTQDEMEQLGLNNQPANKPIQEQPYTGTGSIPLKVTGVEEVARDIRCYTFKHEEEEVLPAYQAGAHINVPVELEDGTHTVRSYSLCHIDHINHSYQIAVKIEREVSGASKAIHHTWHVGHRINIESPDNYFHLHNGNAPALLIAGGIGITPIKAMAEELTQRQRVFELHYTGQVASRMAFIDELKEQYMDKAFFYFSRDEYLPTKLNLKKLVQKVSDETVFYVCGPQPLIQSVIQTAQELGIGRERINFESFK